MGIKTVHSEDPLLEKWLYEFKKKTTRKTYYHALANFKKTVGIQDLTQYVNNHPDVTSDIRKFLAAYDGKPSKTVATYAGAVKSFLQDNGVKVPEGEWRKIKRRGFIPKRAKAETQDKKTAKLNYEKF